jgi:hypothetical protein
MEYKYIEAGKAIRRKELEDSIKLNKDLIEVCQNPNHPIRKKVRDYLTEHPEASSICFRDSNRDLDWDFAGYMGTSIHAALSLMRLEVCPEMEARKMNGEIADLEKSLTDFLKGSPST